jgi:transposase InsO family protein
MGKQARKKFSTSTSCTSAPLEIIHSDVCRPFCKTAYNDARYFVTFIDDYNRRIYLALIKTKNKVFDEFRKFKAQAENTINNRIKILRTDNGGEYLSSQFWDFCFQSGIIHQRSQPYTP